MTLKCIHDGIQVQMEMHNIEDEEFPFLLSVRSSKSSDGSDKLAISV